MAKPKMNHRKDSRRRFHKRKAIVPLMIFMALAACVAWFFANSYTSEYRERAAGYDLARINDLEIPSLILDRNGALIAGNEQNYRVTLTREDAGDVDLVLNRLSRLIPMTADDLDRIKRDLERNSPFVPIIVADRLEWEDFSKIALNAPTLPGVTPEVGLSRTYPLVEDFSHVVGYVGPVSDRDAVSAAASAATYRSTATTTAIGSPTKRTVLRASTGRSRPGRPRRCCACSRSSLAGTAATTSPPSPRPPRC